MDVRAVLDQLPRGARVGLQLADGSEIWGSFGETGEETVIFEDRDDRPAVAEITDVLVKARSEGPE